MDQIPDMVWNKIFLFLNYESRVLLRRVCAKWKDLLDGEAFGLALTVDDRLAQNLDFIASAVIRTAYIVSLRDPPPGLFSYPNLLTVAKFYGRIPVNWLIWTFLETCTRLQTLVFRGDFLCCQELSPPTTPQVICPCLRNLEIVFNEPEAFPAVPRGNNDPLPTDPDYGTPAESLRQGPPLALGGRRFGLIDHAVYSVDIGVLHQADLIEILTTVRLVDRNMIFLLNLIRSPVLQLLHISDVVFPLYGNYDYWDFDWKGPAFRNFVTYHKPSLHHLHIPSYLGNEELGDDWDSVDYPRDLWEVELLLHSRDSVLPAYTWERILYAQENLQELTIQAMRFPSIFYRTMFQHLPPSLRKFVLRFRLRHDEGQNQHRVTFDCAHLAGWRYLEYFQVQNIRGKWGWNDIGFTNERVCVLNLDRLPPTLRILVLRKVNVEAVPVNALAKFRKLKHIQMSTVLTDPNTPEYAAELLKSVTRLRSLNSLEIYFKEPLGPACTDMLVALAAVEPIPPPSGLISYCAQKLARCFGASTPPEIRTATCYRDATGLGLINYMPEAETERDVINGIRILPKNLSNPTCFLELFEAPMNREVTFKNYDPGYLYLAPFQHIYWNEEFKEAGSSVELILRKSQAELERLERMLERQEEIVLGCCTSPIFGANQRDSGQFHDA